MHRVHRVTEGLIDRELGSFRSGRGFVNQTLTLKHISKKAHEEKYSWIRRKRMEELIEKSCSIHGDMVRKDRKPHDTPHQQTSLVAGAKNT